MARPVTGCEKLTKVRPEPRAVPPLAGTRVPKVSLQAPGLAVAKRNQAVVAPPSGLAEPLSVAEKAATLVAASVVTDGACAWVVKLKSDPTVVPSEFWAMAQK